MLGARLIPKDAKVIDIACGNGSLALKMAVNAAHVTGIDLSPGMIKYAKRRAERAGAKNVSFIEMDASDLSGFANKEFDIATSSMAIHQFRLETGKAILQEMSRISKSIMIIDYKYPVPKNLKGLAVKSIEGLAGKEHNQNFKTYIKNEGIQGITKSLGIPVKVIPGFGQSVLLIVRGQ